MTYGKLVGLSLALTTGMRLISCSAPSYASPADAELMREAQGLADLVRTGVEGTLIEQPVQATVDCDYRKEWHSGPCAEQEVLVPFSISGTGGGNAVWNYVARFRKLPAEDALERSVREFGKRPLKHFALRDFAFVAFNYGLIQWETAKAGRGYVDVETRHWLAGDGRANPSGFGRVRISIEGNLALANLSEPSPSAK